MTFVLSIQSGRRSGWTRICFHWRSCVLPNEEKPKRRDRETTEIAIGKMRIMHEALTIAELQILVKLQASKTV